MLLLLSEPVSFKESALFTLPKTNNPFFFSVFCDCLSKLVSGTPIFGIDILLYELSFFSKLICPWYCLACTGFEIFSSILNTFLSLSPFFSLRSSLASSVLVPGFSIYLLFFSKSNRFKNLSYDRFSSFESCFVISDAKYAALSFFTIISSKRFFKNTFKVILLFPFITGSKISLILLPSKKI